MADNCCPEESLRSTILKILTVVGGYLGVSYPPFQTIYFSTMNINHALIRLESVLSRPSSRILNPINHQPLAKSVPDLLASTTPLQRSQLRDTTRSAYPIWLPFPFALTLSNAVALMAFSTPTIHCL